MAGLAVVSTWRNVVELSCMMNNDEFVFYSSELVTSETVKKYIKRGSWSVSVPRLVLSRPVFDIELRENLDTTFSGRCLSYDESEKSEKVPAITLFLDAYFKIKQAVDFQFYVLGQTDPSKFISEYVAYSFYDCMSGGFPLHELMICRMIAQDSRIDKEVDCYPAKSDFVKKTGRDWYKLSDFLEETSNVENSYKEEFMELMTRFSLPMLVGVKTRI